MPPERTRIDQSGKFASVCGLLWRAELKSSRKDQDKKFHVLTMDDGIEIISWHTSPESYESYVQAQGHRVTVLVKTARVKNHTYFYLQSMRITCACDSCKEPAEKLRQPESPLLIL